MKGYVRRRSNDAKHKGWMNHTYMSVCIACVRVLQPLDVDVSVVVVAAVADAVDAHNACFLGSLSSCVAHA